MMNPNLVILAAGIGSRYGGLKQIDSLGPAGEAIIDYSVYDAMEAGFSKIIFVVRQNIIEDFKHFIGDKYQNKIAVSYAIQPDPQFINSKRTKPWGTGQAVLAAADEINSAFAVINADDFYGKSAFVKAHDFLTSVQNSRQHAMVGYPLSITLSVHGTVSRGCCIVTQNKLTSIKEMLEVWEENGEFWFREDNRVCEIPENTIVSMNFWCFQKSILSEFSDGFERFLSKNKQNMKSEFLIPQLINNALIDKKISVSVFESNGPWFGITYKNDKRRVMEKLAKLTEDNMYPSPLWK